MEKGNNSVLIPYSVSSCSIHVTPKVCFFMHPQDFGSSPLLVRLETVHALVRLGASPGAVEDPTSEFPNGQTAADLAASRGYKGIAGFLAEAELASHSSLTLKEDILDSLPEDIVAEMAVETAQELNTIPPTGDRGQELPLRASLAALRNSTQAAAQVRAFYGVKSFCQRQLTEISRLNSERTHKIIVLSSPSNEIQEKSFFTDSLHVAAIKIQQKCHGWKTRKEFLKTSNHIVKIQAYVRGHQACSLDRQILWAASLIEKEVLGWRWKRAGLRGFQAEKATGFVGAETVEADEYEFPTLGRKQVAGTEKALARVHSMDCYPEACDQYMRPKTGFDNER